MAARESDVLSATRREFAVEIAETPDVVREAQRLRYQVYCLERGHSVGEAQTGLEADEYDGRSRHVVLRRWSNGEVVGTVRLVLWSPETPGDSLPMQRYCSPSVFENLPMASLGEISRFALSKQRRLEGQLSDSLRRLALMQGVLRISSELGLTHWCAVMERSLLRLLQATGVHFAPIGPLVEVHGLRQPSVAAIDLILASGKRQCPSFYEFVTAASPQRLRHARELLAA